MRANTTKKKKRKLKKSVIFKSFSLLTFFVSILFFIMFLRLQLFPISYLLFFGFFLLLLNGILYFFLSRKNYKMRMIGTFFSFFFLLFLGIGLRFQTVTLQFLHNISFLNIQTENFNVITLKNQNYQSLKDLDHRKIGFVTNRDSIERAEEHLKQKITFSKTESRDTQTLVEQLLDHKVDAILMEQEEKNLYAELEKEFKESIQVLDTIAIDTVKQQENQDVQITKEPFNIYITGIDTYGKIGNVSRSDVNIVVTVNPNTHRILLTSIPRDYYVSLHGLNGEKDKLTHTGLHGIDFTVQTIEDLLEEDIQYYVKVNFTSLVKIVDSIGGIDVDIPFDFTANYQEEDGTFIYYEFQKGIHHFDGKQALAYSRERYSLREGDVGRARHQQQVIRAILKQLLSPAILNNYATLLGAIEGNFVTNFGFSDITKFVQKQIQELPSWSVETMVLTGTDSEELTYTFPKAYSYVMLPDEDKVLEAVQKINEIMQ